MVMEHLWINTQARPQEFSKAWVELVAAPTSTADAATEMRGSVSCLLRAFPARSYHMKGRKQPHTPLKMCQIGTLIDKMPDKMVRLSDLLVSES